MELPEIKRTDAGELTYKDALKEAMVQEMLRDRRVIVYGEDVADYGGAFKVTKGLLEAFGRERVFNTPISEAAICGTAVGSSMTGLRPVVELMYMDFALMASDQIGNQAAKWHYMSGANVELPLVIRASVGGGKGMAASTRRHWSRCLRISRASMWCIPPRRMTLRACSRAPSATITRFYLSSPSCFIIPKALCRRMIIWCRLGRPKSSGWGGFDHCDLGPGFTRCLACRGDFGGGRQIG